MGIKVDVKKHAAVQAMSERDKDLARQVEEYNVRYAVWLGILEHQYLHNYVTFFKNG